MGKRPDLAVVNNLRLAIGEHLAQIADMLDTNYKLTFIARYPDQPSKTIIVTDDTDTKAVSREVTREDGLITVPGDEASHG